MRIACCGYRDWALDIYDRLARETSHHVLIFRGREHFAEDLLHDFNPDLVLFYGWSWHVPEILTNRYTCLMLHPSPLPRYRGGSPLQNQIIAGETTSAVTLFVMTSEMDKGPIVAQGELSLNGTLGSIFDRITTTGFELTLQIIDEGLRPVPQDESKATYVVRRTPAESEITLDELIHASADYLYNKVRMLADPYPNAFIKTSDGAHLVLRDVSIRFQRDA